MFNRSARHNSIYKCTGIGIARVSIAQFECAHRKADRLPACHSQELSKNGERATQLGAKSINRKMIVQRSSALNAQTLHHGEAGAI
jgi:hypothetical protein